GARIGQRPVATLGALIFAGSFAFDLAAIGPHPEYTTTFLPAFMLGGIGVGLTLGTLPAAATASLPPGRFATGSAVFGMARQLGSAIGVAVLVALIDSAGGGPPPRPPQRWGVALGSGLGAAALAFSLPAKARATASEPAPAAARRR